MSSKANILEHIVRFETKSNELIFRSKYVCKALQRIHILWNIRSACNSNLTQSCFRRRTFITHLIYNTQEDKRESFHSNTSFSYFRKDQS
ncbi:hypothetical protein KFK09_025391 [Dendrobium nobile]|uniref:Uncharacterized protein n=1 Tax=Dendrobium nobile TaxID=94219 RepID=A0A8T3AGT9_DENNO|nr:hypothetical protein KFK09_025391 [Dendrobium nobile]